MRRVPRNDKGPVPRNDTRPVARNDPPAVPQGDEADDREADRAHRDARQEAGREPRAVADDTGDPRPQADAHQVDVIRLKPITVPRARRARSSMAATIGPYQPRVHAWATNQAATKKGEATGQR